MEEFGHLVARDLAFVEERDKGFKGRRVGNGNDHCTHPLTESAILMGSLILIIVLAFGLNKYLADIQIEQKLMGWIAEYAGPN